MDFKLFKYIILLCLIFLINIRNSSTQLSFKQNGEIKGEEYDTPTNIGEKINQEQDDKKELIVLPVSNQQLCLFPDKLSNNSISTNTPEIFLPGLVSVENKNTHALQFSPDGTIMVFSRYPDRKSYISYKTNDKWSDPVEAFFLGKETSFTSDGKRIFYYNEGEIFYVEKIQSGWGKPINAGANINTGEVEYYPSIVNNNTLYFSRNAKWDQGRIMRSEYKNGEYQVPVDQGDLVNAGGASHAWVSYDESYMLFNSPRKGSFTQLDIWVSFKTKNDSWGEPINLGVTINSGADAILCPTVSRDGLYLFFTKLNFNTNTGFIYKVSTKVFWDLKP